MNEQEYKAQLKKLDSEQDAAIETLTNIESRKRTLMFDWVNGKTPMTKSGEWAVYAGDLTEHFVHFYGGDLNSLCDNVSDSHTLFILSNEYPHCEKCAKRLEEYEK